MLVAGIDLAAEPKGTALAIIEFQSSKAKLVYLEQGLDDETLIDKTITADKVGIDCAFGWPIEFAKFIAKHQDPTNQDLIDGGMDFRRTLSFRETDRQVRELTGRWPLSVSTDRLGLTAMRCAGLLSKYQQAGVEIDRSGTGKLAEVYPGATLRNWDFDTTNYRVNNDVRAKLLQEIKAQAPWLDLAGFEDQMFQSTDCFDAVIAALAARAVALGAYRKPAKEQMAKAKVEGWICLPSGDISTLIT
jgi:predicted nuclease with RNAse H fold